jgi:hypothetical protein
MGAALRLMINKEAVQAFDARQLIADGCFVIGGIRRT